MRKVIALTAAALLASAAAMPARAATSPAEQEANKKLILEFYRNVWEAQRLDLMKDYYAPDIIQHNPNVANGIAGFANSMGRFWTPKPVQPTLQNPPVMVLASDDIVTVVFKRQRPEPADPTKTYDTYWFDMFRVKDGRAVEHWDAATKPSAPPAAGAPRP